MLAGLVSRSLSGVCMRLPVLLILFCALAGCQPESDAVRIGSNRWPGYAPYFLADEKGWLAESHVRLVEYPHATGVLRAFGNGLLDGAFLTMDEALRLAADGHDLKLLLVADISAGADVLYARPAIRQLGDLAGKRIGVEDTALGGYFLSRILDQAGLSEQQVTIVSLPVNEHARAMREAQVDAVVSFATEESGITAAGAHRLLDSRELPGAIVDVLVVRRRLPAERLQRLRDLWYDSLGRWQQEPGSVDPQLARRLGLSGADLQAVTAGLQMGDQRLNQQMRREGTLSTQLYLLQSYLLQRGLLPRPPSHPLLDDCQGDAC